MLNSKPETLDPRPCILGPKPKSLTSGIARAGEPAPKAIIDKLLEGHKEDVLSLPGHEHEMVDVDRLDWIRSD
jgi:hypothetical protein